MAKSTRKNSNGKRTLEQREAYHKAALQKIAIGKQIAGLRQQQKALKTGPGR
jgi:hypothetical protein